MMNAQLSESPVKEAVLESLYSSYAQVVYRICYRYTRSRGETEDLVHEIFLKLGDAYRGFAGRCQLLTWIHRVAVNHSLDHLRKKKRRAELLDQFADTHAWDWGADEEAKESPAAARMRDWLETVDQESRQMLFLSCEVGLTHAQIGEICGLSRVAVTRRLGRLKSRVRAAMAPGGRPAPDAA